MINFILKKLKTWWNNLSICEFNKGCKYFTKDDCVCREGGGNYCGQYRQHLKIKKNKKI